MEEQFIFIILFSGTHLHKQKERWKSKERGKRRRRLVLVPCPFQGHINPMLQLGTIFQSKGFSITIIHTTYNSPNPSSHPDFTFLPIPDGLSDREISSRDFIALILNLNINCIAPMQKLLGDRMVNENIACIIYDGLMYFSESVAVQMKLSSIMLQTSNAATLLTRSHYPRLSAKGLIPLQDAKLQDLVEELHPLRFKDLPISNVGTLEDSLKLSAQVCNIRTSSAIIWNTIDDLEHSMLEKLQQLFKVPFFPIGPMHRFAKAPASSTSLITEDTSCITWLNNQAYKSVIYVSLGSVASINEDELIELAMGLANSNQPFLWVVRPGSIRGSNWIELMPEGFEEKVAERGLIVKWAPQKDVLRHESVGGFWSHCGWNSTLECVSEGVPMICQPCFGDQRVNARHLSHVWKVGLQMERKLERGEVEKAIRRLMVENDGKEMRKRAMALKEKVELSIREGGFSYKSLNDLVDLVFSF